MMQERHPQPLQTDDEFVIAPCGRADCHKRRARLVSRTESTMIYVDHDDEGMLFRGCHGRWYDVTDPGTPVVLLWSCCGPAVVLLWTES